MCLRVCEPQLSYTDASTSVLLYCMVMMHTPICTARWAEKFHGDISNLASLCPVFFSACTSCMFSWNLLSKNFALICKLFSLHQWHFWKSSSEFMPALVVASVLSIFVIQKSAKCLHMSHTHHTPFPISSMGMRQGVWAWYMT